MQMQIVTLYVNGRKHQIALEPNVTLLNALRDLGYKLIAANRYRLFGKQESCMLPTPELRARFLDQAAAQS